MANIFNFRLRNFAGPTIVLFVFLTNISGGRQGGDEQTIRRLRAAESGHWLGRWKKTDGTMEWRGTYLAMWRKGNGQWLIQSELYVSLTCQGSKECAD